jgi:WD40 repeat protein
MEAQHKGRVSALAFSPQGRLLVSGGYDVATRLWNIRTGEQLAVCEPMRHKWAVVDLVFSPDGYTVGQVREGFKSPQKGTQVPSLWHLIPRVQRDLLRDGDLDCSPLGLPAFSPSSQFVGIGGTQIRLFDMESGKPADEPFPDDSGCNVIAFSPDGAQIVSPVYGGGW